MMEGLMMILALAAITSAVFARNSKEDRYTVTMLTDQEELKLSMAA